MSETDSYDVHEPRKTKGRVTSIFMLEKLWELPSIVGEFVTDKGKLIEGRPTKLYEYLLLQTLWIAELFDIKLFLR